MQNLALMRVTSHDVNDSVRSSLRMSKACMWSVLRLLPAPPELTAMVPNPPNGILNQ